MPMKIPKGKYIATVKVGEKGQIVIPKGARELFDIQPGDTLLLLADQKRGIALTRYDEINQFFEKQLEAIREAESSDGESD